MAEIFSIRPSEHEAVQMLLPWFVNGSLPEQETARVEEHLSECDECRAELEFERHLARGVATLPLNAEDGWNAMQARLARDLPFNDAGRPNRLFRRPVPIGWVAAGSLAASVAVALVVTGVQQTTAPQQTYHTLGSAPASADGQVVVLFKPDSTEQQMQVILAAQRARIVDGPTAAGAYILHVDGDTARAVEALRQSSQIVLAEPLANDGRP
jgi:hypothetical protein